MFKIPRGTRDFTSEEMQKRRYVEEVMRKTFETFGYKQVQTPTFETLELFTAKSGDTIIEELYSFADKGGRDLALRPELTAPAIRFYVEKLQMEPKPLKLYYFGNCYRYDRPQKGRYREFKQAGCEIIGTDTAEANAELIAMAYKVLENAGVKKLVLNIGNLNILSSLFSQFKLTKDQQKYLIPLIDKSMFEDVFSALKDFDIKKEDASILTEILQTSDIKKIENLVIEDVAKKEVDELKKIASLLDKSFGIKNYQIKMSIVRGLDYYKGIVFEIEAPSLGAEKQLCGGGAYELIKLFGGKETPTAGFAIGFDRTILALELEEYKFPNPTLDVFVIPVNEDMVEKSLNIAQNLREKGIKVDIDLLRRGIGKSLKYASSLNSKKAMIVGQDELEKDSVTIRNMKTGKQELKKISDILK
ncbi:MAG: histidine--tRNA ligase [Thermoplasmatales archaeon]|nr:histidine--tRNA ligase [Thermoplasmatales archaeon]